MATQLATTEFDADERRHLEALAVAAGAGDGDALASLLQIVQPLVSNYCRARLASGSSVHSGEDIAQEVCVALIAALPHYRNDNSSFFSFLFRIAARKVTDAYRGMATTRRYLEVVEEVPDTALGAPEPEEAALQAELAGRVDGLLAHLPAHHRAILTLRVAVGLSAVETARVLRTTPGAVRVAQHRALTALRALLVEERGDDVVPAIPMPRGPIER